MKYFKNNKKNTVCLEYIFARLLVLNFEENPIDELIEKGQEQFGRNSKILYIGDRKRKFKGFNGYAIYANLSSTEPVPHKNDPYLAYAGSFLTLLWIDDNLDNILNKIQKHLKEISWDKHAINVYS